jgi:membrane protein
MSTILFTMVYIVIPYTYVRLSSALWAGIFAGCAYQILQATYINIQIQISNAGAIYGSFAALPLFLMWLYLSWVIFLIGAEIVAIHQERLWNTKVLAPYRNLTLFERELTYLACVKASVDAYLQANPITIEELSRHLRMPERLVTELVEELVSCKLLLKSVQSDGENIAIVPAINPDTLRIFDVLHTVEGTNELQSPLIETFSKLLSAMQKELVKAHSNVLLKDIEVRDR